MATKRMFSKHIVDSDAFLEMPLSTQALYFHLNMKADDDGFVGSPKRIMRMIGANEDEYKVLIAKKFGIQFEGQSVCVIKHWLVHNVLRKDTYKPTLYDDLKRKILKKNNNIYTLGNEAVTERQRRVDIGKVSKGKVSLVKVSKTPVQNGQLLSKTEIEFIDFWNAYPRKEKKQSAYKTWLKVKPPINEVLSALQWQKNIKQWTKNGGVFIPLPSTYLNAGQWEDQPIVNELDNF